MYNFSYQTNMGDIRVSVKGTKNLM